MKHCLISPPTAITVPDFSKPFPLRLPKFQVACSTNINLTNETWKLSAHILQFFYHNRKMKETDENWNIEAVSDISS